jgi:hypothetical protein
MPTGRARRQHAPPPSRDQPEVAARWRRAARPSRPCRGDGVRSGAAGGGRPGGRGRGRRGPGRRGRRPTRGGSLTEVVAPASGGGDADDADEQQVEQPRRMTAAASTSPPLVPGRSWSGRSSGRSRTRCPETLAPPTTFPKIAAHFQPWLVMRGFVGPGLPGSLDGRQGVRVQADGGRLRWSAGAASRSVGWAPLVRSLVVRARRGCRHWPVGRVAAVGSWRSRVGWALPGPGAAWCRWDGHGVPWPRRRRGEGGGQGPAP